MESLALSDDITELRLVGRLDLAGTEAISDTFLKAASERNGRIIVDLSSVVFLTSAGIRLLLSSAKALTSRGGQVILASPQRQVRHIIEASGIDQVMEFVDDVDTAIARLKG